MIARLGAEKSRLANPVACAWSDGGFVPRLLSLNCQGGRLIDNPAATPESSGAHPRVVGPDLRCSAVSAKLYRVGMFYSGGAIAAGPAVFCR